MSTWSVAEGLPDRVKWMKPLVAAPCGTAAAVARLSSTTMAEVIRYSGLSKPLNENGTVTGAVRRPPLSAMRKVAVAFSTAVAPLGDCLERVTVMASAVSSCTVRVCVGLLTVSGMAGPLARPVVLPAMVTVKVSSPSFNSSAVAGMLMSVLVSPALRVRPVAVP